MINICLKHVLVQIRLGPPVFLDSKVLVKYAATELGAKNVAAPPSRRTLEELSKLDFCFGLFDFYDPKIKKTFQFAYILPHIAYDAKFYTI